MNNIKLFTVILGVVIFLTACKDQGDPVSAPTAVPTITSVVPDSGIARDTIIIIGANFGTTQNSGIVSFRSANASTIISWSATQIKVIVPAYAISGVSTIKVTADGLASNQKSFKILGNVSEISFATNINPLFATYGCNGCHPGNGGLSLATYTTLIAGGGRGPAVTPNNADGSIIVQKLRGQLGSRMPLGGSAMANSDIQKIVDWINQGALDN